MSSFGREESAIAFETPSFHFLFGMTPTVRLRDKAAIEF